MKKLAFITMFGLGSLMAFAQVTDPSQQTTDPTQQTTDPTQQTTDPTRQTTDPNQPQTTNPTEQRVDPTQQRTTDPTERQTADPDQQPVEDNTRERATDANRTQTADPDQQPMEGDSTMEQGGTAQGQDGYNEIAKRKLPGDLKKAMKQNYPDAKIEQAYSNEQGQYKVDVTMEDGTTETMYMDKGGNPMEQ
ncbi:MAG: hypothetical protein WA913_12610 [Pricia sp.]